MPKLFDDDEGEDAQSEFTIRTDNAYAKKYDDWRKKEELHKLQMKYGDIPLNDNESETSSSSDEEPLGKLTEEEDKKFFKTLSRLMANKDPGDINEETTEGEVAKPKEKKKKKKDRPLFIKDYQRKFLLEKGGIEDESEEEKAERPNSPTYIEQQKQLKESLKEALNSVDDSDGEDTFKPKTGSAKENSEIPDYKKWLAGGEQHLADEDLEDELKPLKDYWNDPNLDEGEKFLRDYVLNNGYQDKEEETVYPTFDELSEDEREIEEAEEFEYKYNFRFEEPDNEYIKTYPRTIENSLRRTDNKRKEKRIETKERKQREKQQKMEEIKRLQELKKKEIEEKIAKLKEITGNTDLGFDEQDVDGDFDPDLHDKRLQELFNDDFYQGPEGEQKPEFPEFDEELEIENWSKWEGRDDSVEIEDGGHCEDPNFIMDCDYDPQNASKELVTTKGKKPRKRKSKFAEALAKPKPVFDPNDKTYEDYLDEYYNLDCEDIIGDIPCRFKYRKVEPNSFGLTIEEILMANDRELNRWCSLKKVIQHRPQYIEKNDEKVFSRRAQNIALKKKILPSLFSEQEGDSAENNTQKKNKNSSEVNKSGENQTRDNSEIIDIHNEEGANESVIDESGKISDAKKKKKNKKKKKTKLEASNKNSLSENENLIEESEINPERKRKHSSGEPRDVSKSPKKARKFNGNENEKPGSKPEQAELTNARLASFGYNHTQKKSKKSSKVGKSIENQTKENSEMIDMNNEVGVNDASNENIEVKLTKKKKEKYGGTQDGTITKTETLNESGKTNDVKKKKKKKKQLEASNRNSLSVNENPVEKTKVDSKKKRKKKHSGEHNDVSQSHPAPKKARKMNKIESNKKPGQAELSDARLASFGFNPKKYRNKLKYKK